MRKNMSVRTLIVWVTASRVKKLLCYLVLVVGLAGCAAPVNPALWNPRPHVVEVLEDLEFQQKGVGKLFVPRAEYTYWYSNKFGHFYGNDSSRIRVDYKTAFGTAKTEEFKGGIWLSNRIDAVLVYQLSSVAEDAKKVGEVAHLAAWEAGDKDGLARNWKGQIPAELRSKLNFK